MKSVGAAGRDALAYPMRFTTWPAPHKDLVQETYPGAT
jgi:hypothetical protein